MASLLSASGSGRTLVGLKQRRSHPEPPAVRSPAWEQNIDRPLEWGEEHLWFLEAAYDYFEMWGDWPSTQSLEEALAPTAPARALDVAQLAIDIPSALAIKPARQIQLSVLAMSLIPAAQPLLALLMSAMQEARQLYPGPQGQPAVLTGDLIKAKLRLDDETYHRLSVVLLDQGWFLGSGGGDPDGAWDREVPASILRLNGVTTVEGYVQALAIHRFGPALVEPPAVEPRQSPLGSIWLWWRKREVSAGDLVMIGVVATVAGGLLLAWIIG